MFSSRLSNLYFCFRRHILRTKIVLGNWISINTFDHSANFFQTSGEKFPVGLSNVPSTCPQEPFRKMFVLKNSYVQRNNLRQKTFVWKRKMSKLFLTIYIKSNICNYRTFFRLPAGTSRTIGKKFRQGCKKCILPVRTNLLLRNLCFSVKIVS